MRGRARSFRVPKNVGFTRQNHFFHKLSENAQIVGSGDSISYRLMRLKKDFLKIHFSNCACSVARTHPSDMPAKTLEKSGETHKHTIQLSPTDYKGASHNHNNIICAPHETHIIVILEQKKTVPASLDSSWPLAIWNCLLLTHGL